MIEELSTSLLLPGELAETVSSYKKAIEKAELENPFITRIITLLTADLETLNSAITAVRTNHLVDDVATADAIRDDLFIGFRDSVKAFRRRRNPELQEAYEQIWNLIEKAGTRLYYLGYAEQSGKLEALLAELDKQENQAALSLLKLIELYDELKQAQEAFTELYAERLDEDAELDYPTLRDAKSRTVPHVNALLNTLDILEETEPGVHDDLISKINGITTAIMTTARTRKSRVENAKANGASAEANEEAAE